MSRYPYYTTALSRKPDSVTMTSRFGKPTTRTFANDSSPPAYGDPAAGTGTTESDEINMDIDDDDNNSENSPAIPRDGMCGFLGYVLSGLSRGLMRMTPYGSVARHSRNTIADLHRAMTTLTVILQTFDRQKSEMMEQHKDLLDEFAQFEHLPDTHNTVQKIMVRIHQKKRLLRLHDIKITKAQSLMETCQLRMHQTDEHATLHTFRRHLTSALKNDGQSLLSIEQIFTDVYASDMQRVEHGIITSDASSQQLADQLDYDEIRREAKSDRIAMGVSSPPVKVVEAQPSRLSIQQQQQQQVPVVQRAAPKVAVSAFANS